jgi:protein-disulfide isomerase
MPSGKASRTGRRTGRVPPPPRSKSTQRARRANPRVLGGVAAVVAAAAVAIVVAVVLTRGSSSAATNAPVVGSAANGLPGATAVHALFKGIPQSGTTLGRANAPVTMVEYVDLQCPYCQAFETQVLPGLVNKYVRPGILKIELRPWAFIGLDSNRGQAAVLAAAQQNRAFNFAELLYDNQGVENSGWLSDNMVTGVASSITGLRVHALLSATSSGAVKAAVQKVDNLVRADNVTSTPTILVGKTGTHGTTLALKSPTDSQTVTAAITALEN